MSDSTNNLKPLEKQPEKVVSGGMKRNRVWRTMQFFLQGFFILWFRYRVSGKENIPANSGALLLINHQSYLDPIIVGLSLKRPVSYLARNTLFQIPLLGWLLRSAYVMSINRDAAGTESLRLSMNRLKQGYLVGLFPEGTRTLNGELGELKPGFIAIARRSNTPIIPVGISGAFRAMPKGALFIRPSIISIHYGKPIAPEKLEELTKRGHEQEFMTYITEQIQQAVQKTTS